MPNRENPMPFTLSPEIQRQIMEKVESGEYASADEVLGDALRLQTERDEDYATRVEALRGEIQKGLDDFDVGRHSSMDEAFARLRTARGMPG